MRLRFFAYLSLSLLLLTGLDRLIYDWGIFAGKNPSGWDSFRWYNFEYNDRALRRWRKRNPEKKLVLIVGSSIARYAAQAHILEALLREKGLHVAVRNFNHAAMMSADLFFYRSRLAAIRPDLLLYITNPADLDLERYTEPWQSASDYATDEAERFLSMRHPARLLYPGAFADFYGLRFGLDDYLSRRLYASFASLRLREEWMDPLRFRLKAERGFVKSYLNYQGIRITEGLWRTGHSIACLSIPKGALAKRGGGRFRFEIPPELATKNFHIKIYKKERTIGHVDEASANRATEVAQAGWEDFLWHPEFHSKAPSGFRKFIKVFLAKRGSVVDCSEKSARLRLLRSYRDLGKGWQALDLPENEISGLFVQLSHVLDRRGRPVDAARHPVGKGIRLPAFFGLGRLPERDVYVRRPDWEGRELYLAGDALSRRIFLEKNEPPDWRKRPANRQLNFLRLGKYYTNWYSFEPKRMPQARFLHLWIREMEGRKAKVLILNNPENPVTLADYTGVGRGPLSPWYRAYLLYLQRVCHGSHCRFLDFHRQLSERYFSDAHHLTYEGMLRMAPVYADAVARFLQENADTKKATIAHSEKEQPL